MLQGHWRIESNLFHVKDDSLGEYRHVMQQNRNGAVLSLLRSVALTLSRTVRSLWSSNERLTGEVQRLGVQPTAVLC